ncbi:hypothetical protein IVB43_30425 [Bradyrhizobium sp. 48]|uniref:hypothetical protein n=1 Tax=Bradyrhizobium sp. 48 TaxID=2782676 RepID=UPI001FFBE797|nr:hypothetical protein [Bradyrhizobium sp. 48]MCK1446692.1 hypothetical protein [Bradyrhizobium sp. 48]
MSNKRFNALSVHRTAFRHDGIKDRDSALATNIGAQTKAPAASRATSASALRAAIVTLTSLLASSGWGMALAQGRQYPPQSAYLMPREAEIALAKSAAPAHISDRATIKILTANGYKTAHEGDSGFVCLVMRGWANSGTYTPVAFRNLGYDATIRAPACFIPSAARTILPYVEMKDTLGMQGKTPDQIAEAVQVAYATGKLPKRDEVTFAYMWSADQHLNSGADQEGVELGHGWHPHMMVYAPYFENSMLGGNAFGSMPIVGDDAGTPFAVIYVPLDRKLAVTPQQK